MILCIDTITEHAGITLVDSKKSYGYQPFAGGKIAESILKTIDKVLRRARIQPTKLTGVLVIKGPGSFTSLRVGLAVANQFAHQLKIPIIGLRTDEWWLSRTDERPVMYLQSMNREEVYAAGAGAPTIEKLYQLYNLYKSYNFLGQLTDEHRAKLPPNWRELANLKSPADTWVAAAQVMADKPVAHKLYALVEPFYGKEPTITKSKKQ
ncbi:MAG: tRNA (adenosine(37)-N6)-threonylcarbamoyltransferase complex dimerization subunit type 1 TsaB [Candidatus Peregrinibacteria bacterium]